MYHIRTSTGTYISFIFQRTTRFVVTNILKLKDRRNALARLLILISECAERRMMSTGNRKSTSTRDSHERETKRTRLTTGDDLQNLRNAEHQRGCQTSFGLVGPAPVRPLFMGHNQTLIPPASTSQRSSSSSSFATGDTLLNAQLLLAQAHLTPRTTSVMGSQQLGGQFCADFCLLNAIVLGQRRRQQELLQVYHTSLRATSRPLPTKHNDQARLPVTSAQGNINLGKAQRHGANILPAPEARFAYRGSFQQPQQAQASTLQTITRSQAKVSKPRRPLTAFNLFFKEERLKLKKEYESLSFRFMGQEISRRWKSLQDRTKYRDLALAEKRRYSSEMEAYKRSMQGALTQAFDEQMEKVPESAYQEYLDRVKDDEIAHRQRRKRRL